MRRILLSLALVVTGAVGLGAQECTPPEGKLIYIPKKLRHNDFQDPTSQWSFCRMACTDDIAVFWERGFGDDLATAPPLEEQPMTVDLDNLLTRLQTFYDFYRDSLLFILPGSKAERYRMMVMLNYSLEGTAYGGDYDEQIGALWIAPNRVQDSKLNCIAHELGHSFQSQIGSDGTGESWGGGGIFEMASQWMLWNVNPDWTTEENYHWQAFRQSFNKRFLDIENIYRSPYVLEYWAMLHGLGEIADLFREGRKGEDPAQTYMRVHGLTLAEMNDEMADCYSRLLSFDFPRVKDSHRHMAGELTGQEPMGTWGFNVVELPLSTGEVTFESLSQDPNASFRYQLVGLDANQDAHYYGIHSDDRLTLTLTLSPEEGTQRLFLVIVACPRDEYQPLLFDHHGRPRKPSLPQEDYNYKLTY